MKSGPDLAIMIADKETSKPASDKPKDKFSAAARDIIAAVKDDDAQALAAILRALVGDDADED